MARKKVAPAVVQKERKPRKDPRIEQIYEEEVEFNCPIRGKVKQKVKIKKFKTMGDQVAQNQRLGSNEIDALEESDDGLSIYSDGQEPDDGGDIVITGEPGEEA